MKRYHGTRDADGTYRAFLYAIQLHHYADKTEKKRTGDPFSLKPQRKMSPCPIKKGHFETHHVTLSRAINTVSLSVVKEDF